MPPEPRVILGSEDGVIASSVSAWPIHTLPVALLHRAVVAPPIIAAVLPSVAAFGPVPSVDAATLLTLEPSSSIMSLPCCATSNLVADAETAASASPSATLNRAALRCSDDVTHTVPSSRLTCWRVTESAQTAPMAMTASAINAARGAIHRRS